MVGGLVTQGYITENMPLAVGPFEDGKFRDVHVSSIRRNKAACRCVKAFHARSDLYRLLFSAHWSSWLADFLSPLGVLA